MTKIYPIGSEPKKDKPKKRWIRNTFNEKVDPKQEKAGKEALDKLVANAKAARDYKNRNRVDGIINVKCRVPEKYKPELLKYAEILRLKG